MKEKIILVVKNYLPYSETFIYDQIKSLQTYFEVYVICQNFNGIDQFYVEKIIEIKENKSFVHRIQHFLYQKGLILPFININENSEFVKQIQIIKPKCILFHFGTTLRNFNICPVKNIPIFVYFHGYDASAMFSTSFFYKLFLKNILNKKNVYPIFVSDGLKKIFESHFGKKINAFVNHLGIDLTKFPDFPQNPQKNKIGIELVQIARLVPKKGHAYTIEALNYCQQIDKNFNFFYKIIGSGPLEEVLKTQVKKLGLENNIHFLGALDHQDINQHLKHADIFIQHSITPENGDSEGLPISLIEALAMNLPVISTIHSGIPELIPNQEFGLLSEEKDVADFAKKILLVREKIGKIQSRDWVNTHFNIKIQTEKLVEYIKTKV